MVNFFIVNKKEGETPLEALEVFRKKNKIYKEAKMTYAGRLDPMASGLLLILAGEEVKNKEKYLNLDKEYEFKILFGFATDTYDILGKVIEVGASHDLTPKLIKENLKYFTGKFVQKYPLYSSKTIKKVRAGKSVKASSRVVNVKSLKFIKLSNVSSTKLLADIKKRVSKVQGDFRQKEILAIWNKYLRTSTLIHTVASFKIKCSSGTYVRGVANSLGEKISIPTLAFSIKRTKLGKWSKIKK